MSYTYRVIKDNHDRNILLKDDGYRIYGKYIDDEVLTCKEWELIFDYKHCEYPAIAESIIDMIMDKKQRSDCKKVIED